MNKLNRKEFKDLLLEWNKNFVNERLSPNIKKNIEDITSSNTSTLSNYNLNIKMNNLPISLIEINNNITRDSEKLKKLIKAIYKDSLLSNNIIMCEHDDNENFEGQSMFMFNNNKRNFLALVNLLKKFEVIDDNSINQEDIKKSSIIIFKDKSFNADYYDSFYPERLQASKYDNTLWTLHDIMHRFVDYTSNHNQISFDSADCQSDLFKKFYKETFNLLSINNKKYNKHLTDSSDFAASWAVFLFLYIIEVENNNINIAKSTNNLNSFLEKFIEIQKATKEDENLIFKDTVEKKSLALMHRINNIINDLSYIQLLLFKWWY